MEEGRGKRDTIPPAVSVWFASSSAEMSAGLCPSSLSWDGAKAILKPGFDRAMPAGAGRSPRASASGSRWRPCGTGFCSRRRPRRSSYGRCCGRSMRRGRPPRARRCVGTLSSKNRRRRRRWSGRVAAGVHLVNGAASRLHCLSPGEFFSGPVPWTGSNSWGHVCLRRPGRKFWMRMRWAGDAASPGLEPSESIDSTWTKMILVLVGGSARKYPRPLSRRGPSFGGSSTMGDAGQVV